jgi:hypothetical protein
MRRNVVFFIPVSLHTFYEKERSGLESAHSEFRKESNINWYASVEIVTMNPGVLLPEALFTICDSLEPGSNAAGLRQCFKQPSPKVSTLAGMRMDDNEVHSQKAHSKICDSWEFDSNVTWDSFLHDLKQLSSRTFTLDGIHMDNNELHSSKALFSIRDSLEPGWNVTTDKFWYALKQSLQKVSMLGGMHRHLNERFPKTAALSGTVLTKNNCPFTQTHLRENGLVSCTFTGKAELSIPSTASCKTTAAVTRIFFIFFFPPFPTIFNMKHNIYKLFLRLYQVKKNIFSCHPLQSSFALKTQRKRSFLRSACDNLSVVIASGAKQSRTQI